MANQGFASELVLRGLRALSRRDHPQPLPRIMAFAQTVAADIDWTEYDTARAQLEDANAFLSESAAEETGRGLRRPT